MPASPSWDPENWKRGGLGRDAPVLAATWWPKSESHMCCESPPRRRPAGEEELIF